MNFVGMLGLPRVELEAMSFHHSFQIRSYLLHSEFLKNTDVGKGVVQRLASDRRVQALENQMLSLGNSAARFEVDTLAVWYVWCLNMYGNEFADCQLESWLASEEVEVLNSLWVLGLEAEKSFELGGGYSIQILADMPDSDEKEYFSKVDFNFLSRSTLPKCAITKKENIKKTRSDFPPGTNGLNDNFRESCQKLYELAFVLNSISGVTCVPHFQTAYRSSVTPVGHFGGSGGGSPLFDVSTITTSKISPESSSVVFEVFSAFRSKSAEERSRLQVVLSRLSQAKRRSQIEDQMLDLGIALEMLLLQEKLNSELSLQFRIRGSWLLGQSFEDRIEINQLLKEIYDARSSVAHSGALYRSDPRKLELVRTNFSKYVALAESTVRKIIVDGSPCWDDVLLRGQQVAPDRRYIKELVRPKLGIID